MLCVGVRTTLGRSKHGIGFLSMKRINSYYDDLLTSLSVKEGDLIQCNKINILD